MHLGRFQRRPRRTHLVTEQSHRRLARPAVHAGDRGGLLPWALLVVGSMASPTANVAVAEPAATARVIAAWPSFALIWSYELLTKQVREAGR